MPLSEQQITTACEWWARAITAPRFDNGDATRIGAMAQLMASANTSAVSSEQAGTFKEVLAAILRLEEKEEVWLSVDYDPDKKLAEAMTAAGIRHKNAPWKTRMWIRDGGVCVSAGYGAPRQDLLPPTKPAA